MKRSFQLIHFISIQCIAIHCMAQTERINTDRPDQSDGVDTKWRNHCEIHLSE